MIAVVSSRVIWHGSISDVMHRSNDELDMMGIDAGPFMHTLTTKMIHNAGTISTIMRMFVRMLATTTDVSRSRRNRQSRMEEFDGRRPSGFGAERRRTNFNDENHQRDDDGDGTRCNGERDEERDDENADDAALLSMMHRLMRNTSGPQFTFKDVEESLTKFSGDDGQNICDWFDDFDENAKMLRWSKL